MIAYRRWFALVATAAALVASPCLAQEDENPTTPGAIPNPGTYQGSMQLQQQSDRQDQQFRQQQQSQSPTTYGAPRPYAGPSTGVVRSAPAPAPPPRVDAGQSQEAATPEAVAASAANNRGDYAEAVRLWRILAGRGSADAEYNLGVMYDEGHGVPVNKTMAADWYLKAADKGMGQAMSNLAVLYVQRSEAAENLIQAYKWLSLAIDHDPEAHRATDFNNRKLVGADMTQAQISQAVALAQAWNTAHPAAAHYVKPESPAPSGPANALLKISSTVAGPGWQSPMPGAIFWVLAQDPTPILATFGSAPTPLDQLGADCRTPANCTRDIKALTAKAVGSFKTDASGQGQLQVAPGHYYVLGAGVYQGKAVLWFRPVDVHAPVGGMTLDQTDGLILP